MSEDIVRNVVLKSDEAAINKLVSDVNRVDKEFDALQDELNAIDKAAKKTAKTLPDAFDSRSIKRGVSEIERAERAMRDYGEAASAAAKRTEALGDIDTNLSAIRGLGDFAGAGAATAPLQVASEIAAAAEGFGRLGPALAEVAGQAIEGSAAGTKLASGLQSAIPGLTSTGANLATLGITAAGVGVAIGAVVAAFNEFNKQAEQQAAAFTAQFEARRELSQEIAIGTLTLDEAQSRLEEYNARLAASEQVYADARAAYDDFEEGFGVATAAVKVFSSQEDALSKAVKAAREDTQSYEAQIAELTRAIESGSLATNDAAAAEEALNEQRAAAANAIAQIEQNLLAARSQSADAINKQVETLTSQVAIYEEQRAALEAAGQDTSALSQQIDVMSETARRLTNEILPQAEANERAAKQVERLTEQYEAEIAQREELVSAVEDFNDDIVSIQERAYDQLAAIQERYNDAQVKAAQKLADDQQKLADKLADAVADISSDASKALADAQADYQQEQLEALADAQKEEAQAAQEQARKLAQIKKDAAQDELDAAADRDFRRLFQIRQSTGDQLDAAKEEFNEERAQRQADLQERLADISQAFAEEQAEIQRNYQERLADAQAQAAKERAQIQVSYQERRQELQDSLDEETAAIERERAEQIAAREEAIQRELAIVQSGHEAREELERQHQMKLVAQAQAILGGGLGGLSSATGGAGLGGFGGFGGIFNTGNTTNASVNQTFNFQEATQAAIGQVENAVLNVLDGLLPG